MIFASLGLLILSAVLLAAGIGKSSMPMLVLSLVSAVVASGMLLLAHSYHRLRLKAEGGAGSGDVTVGPGVAGSTEPLPTPASTGGNGHAPMAAASPPVAGYDDLNATDAAALADALGLEELHRLRRYEVEHAGRKTVLHAVDRRIEHIVQLRRQVTGGV